MNVKTYKVLDMTACGLQIYCIYHRDAGQYWLYCKWYEYKSETDFGYHRKLVAKYDSMLQVLDHIRNFIAKKGA